MMLQRRVFTALLVALLIGIVSITVYAQPVMPPLPPITSDTLVLIPDVSVHLVLDNNTPALRYLFLARQGEAISLNAQRTAGDGVLVLKLSSVDGTQLEEGQSNDLAGDQTQLQFPVTVDGWYWLDATLDPNGGSNSGTFKLQLTGTTPYLMTLEPSRFPLTGTISAHMVDLFTLTASPTTTVTLTPSQTLAASDTRTPSITPSLTLTKKASPTPAPSLTLTPRPNTGTFTAQPTTEVHISTPGLSDAASGCLAVAAGSATVITSNDIQSIIPTLGGVVLEVTQAGGPLNARSSPSTSAHVLRVLHWGDRVLWKNNRVPGFLKVYLNDGSTAYISDDPNYVRQVDPAQITSGLFINAALLVNGSGDGSHLRVSTSTLAKEIHTLVNGETLTVVGGPCYSEYYIWWQLKTASGAVGWHVDIPNWWQSGGNE